MPDKTKATLVKELAAANRRAAKAEKAVAKAEEEAEEGVEAATSKIAELEAIISGGSHNSDGHVCPRTSKALGRDEDVYATEKRLRAERNDWRSFSGGVPGQRGSNELSPQATAKAVPQASGSSPSVKSESLLREERNAARKAAGGHSGQRGPLGATPGVGLTTAGRLAAERDAWLSVGKAPSGAAVSTPQPSEKVEVPVSGDILDKIVVEVIVRKA